MAYASPESGLPVGTPGLPDELVRRFVRNVLTVPTSQLSDVGSWHAHVPFAYALMALLRPRLTVELGVHKGDSYLTFCRGLLDHGVEGRLAGVDTWQGDSHAGAYSESTVLSNLKDRHDPYFAHVSTLLKKTFDEALSDIDDGSVDLLHIDGLHTYEAVRHDFETWWPKLSPRAVVLFHDTTVREGDFGVWKLWAEIGGLGPSHEFEYGNGLGVLAPGTGASEDIRSLLAALKTYPIVNGLTLTEFLRLVGNGLADSRRVIALSQEKDCIFDEWMDERKRALAEIERLNTEWTDERRRAMAEIERLNMEIVKIQKERMTWRFWGRRTSHNQHGRAGAIEPASVVPAVLKVRNPLQNAEHGESHSPNPVDRPHIASETSGLADRQTIAEGDDVLARQEIERLRGEWSAERRQAQAEMAKMGAELSALRTALSAQEETLQRLSVGEPNRLRLPRNPRELKSSLTSTVAKAQRASQPVLQTAGRATLALLPLGPEGRVRVKNKLLDTFGGIFGIQRGYITPSPVVSVGNVSFAVPGERYRNLALSARGRPKVLPERSVSIVIPVYNQIDYTLSCLESIKANTLELEYEIIVVDDCSSDQTSAILSGREGITYVRNMKNLGFIGSCNAGAAHARKTYLCFLNNDTNVLPNWLSALVNTFELHEHVGLAGSKLIFPDGRLQEAGGLIWNDGSGWNWGRLQDQANPRFNYARNADYCSGASILVPRALFRALDGFDRHYTPAYGEDSDLAFKIRSLGLSTVYQPLSQVVHYEGVTSGTDLNAGVKKHQVVNAQKLAKRWAPALKHQGEPGVDPDIVSDRGTIGRILVLDQITPEPDRDAGSITALEIIRALRDLGYKITFVPCSNFTWLPPYSELLASLGIESVVLPWAENMTAHLKRFGAAYDAVVIFRPQTWHDYIGLIREHAPKARVVYHSSDLHFLRDERERLVAEKTGGHGPDKLEAAKQAELDLISSADVCIVHSIAEKELLGDLRPSCRVVCFPWIYEPRGEGPDFVARRDLIFVGGYGHPPNVDAAQYFIRDIFPKLTDKLPEDTKFIAAGSFPPAALQAAAGPTVEVPGYVEDLEPLLFNARVMVVPLRYGAGIKGKIVAGLAHGLPIVTTSLGAEGMGLTHEVDVLIADGPEEFAAAVARLYADEALWLKLRQAGLDYVSRTTSRDAGLKIVSELLNKIALPSALDLRAANAVQPGKEATAFGSRPTLFRASNLVAAARAACPSLGQGARIVVPEGLLTRARDEGLDAVALSEFMSANTAAGPAIIVADATDSNAIEAIAGYCRTRVASAANVVIIFAPARLEASSSGFEVLAPFEDKPAGPLGPPVHERWQDAFGAAGHDGAEWIVDKSLTGFPGLTVLRIRAQ